MSWLLGIRNRKIIKNSVPWSCSRCGWRSKGYTWVSDDVVVSDSPELFMENSDGSFDALCRMCADEIYEMDVLSMIQEFDKSHGIGQEKDRGQKTPVYGS